MTRASSPRRGAEASALFIVLGCFGLGLSVDALSCKSRRSGSDAELVRTHLLATAPVAMSHASGARLGEGVVYIGCDVDAVTASAGGTLSVTHYFLVEAPPGPGWALFTHVVSADEGAAASGEWMNADASAMRRAHPVRAWKAGQIIADPQVITIDADWAASSASVRLGMFRTEGADKGARMKVSGGEVDGEGRLIACDVAVRKREAGRATAYAVRRADGVIQIDGKGDEPAWRSAPWSGWFVTAKGGKDPVGRARARLLWDDSSLYALIEVEDDDVFSPFQNRDDTLWKADVVELFIDADGNGRGYVELQVNPNNAVFDAYFPQTRGQKHHFEWNSSLRSAVVVDGDASSRDGRDRAWTAEIAIPHTDVKGMDVAMKIGVPPQIGDRWRLNVIRVDKAKDATSITASSWNPITIRDFHALGRMMTVVFSDKDGRILLEEGREEGREGQPAPP